MSANKLGENKMSEFKIRPLEDRVIVKSAAPEEKTKGGIILPDTVKEKPVEGTIVAAGPGRIKDDGNPISMNVKVGDKVLYGKYSGTEITVDDDEFLIMRESDIFGVLA